MTRLIGLTTVLVVASVAVWFLLGFQPARQQQAALEAQTAALQQEEAQLANQREQLLALRDRAPELREQLDRLSALVPPDPDQARLLELVQAAATASGVSFTSLAFTEPLPVPGAPPTGNPDVVLGATTVSGGMRATYFQLVDFLRRLEIGSSRAILVTRVGLLEGPGGFPQLDASFSADIFSLIPAPAVVETAPEAFSPTPGGTPAPTTTPVPTPTTPLIPVPTAVPTADAGAQSPQL